MNRLKTTAFTLVELLVVIAVIAILAGIALPVFAKVLERGKVTQDASNLRQLGAATASYLNDNNKTIFSSATYLTSTTTGSSNRLYAPGLLEVNYIPNLQIFRSPFDKRAVTTNPSPVSYGVNANLLTPPSATSGGFQGNFGTIVAESQLILYAPSYVGDPTLATSWKGLDNAVVSLPMGGVGMTTGPQENGKWINVLYADYHVVNIKFTTFQTITNQSTSNANGVNGLTQWYPLGVATSQ